jgi:phosphoribosylformimino-5-aminoimidazole carboxamide ribotide isomerase
VLALDVRNEGGEPGLATHGWTRRSGTTLWEALERFGRVGMRHVLCTDVARDGMMNGPNLPLYQRVLDRFPQVLVQASGGVRNVADLSALREARCAAAITGRALLDRSMLPAEVMTFLRDA